MAIQSIAEREQQLVSDLPPDGGKLLAEFAGNGNTDGVRQLLDLGVNVINWLAGDDTLITIQPRPSLDSGLDLGIGARYLILFGFLIVLPLAFATTGVLIWWRRRKA